MCKYTSYTTGAQSLFLYHKLSAPLVEKKSGTSWYSENKLN